MYRQDCIFNIFQSPVKKFTGILLSFNLNPQQLPFQSRCLSTRPQDCPVARGSSNPNTRQCTAKIRQKSYCFTVNRMVLAFNGVS